MARLHVTCVSTLHFQSLMHFNAFFVSKHNPFKNTFDFPTASDWDCLAAVEQLPTLHYSVDFYFLGL